MAGATLARAATARTVRSAYDDSRSISTPAASTLRKVSSCRRLRGVSPGSDRGPLRDRNHWITGHMSKLSDEGGPRQVHAKVRMDNSACSRPCLSRWSSGAMVRVNISRTVVQVTRDTGVHGWRSWPIARVDCSSTASSSPAARARSRPSTRPPRRCSASPPMPASTTWAAAIGAARRAFDDTDWSTNVELRVRCIRQLQQALRDHAEELRELAIAEVGAPRMLTSMAQFDGPVEDLSFCADTAESYQWITDFGIAAPMGIKTHRTIAREADRGRRRHHAVELPEPDQPRQARARAGGGQHRGAQAGARHPVERGGARSADPRAHRHPGGRRQHRHVQRPRRRCAAVEGPARRHGVVHRVDEHRARGDGRRCGHAQEGVPRTRRQVGVPGTRRRGSRRRVLDVGVHGVDARRPGLRDHHPTGGAAGPLRRGRRGGGGHDGRAEAGRPERTPAPSADR